jgi:hypothetical protein
VVEAEELGDPGQGLVDVAPVHDAGYPERLRGADVVLEVVDEHALMGRQAEPLGGEVVDRRIRLAQPDLA